MSDRLFRLDGRVALVTGASSGLGARFARVLAGAGARVVLVARREERLEALAAELDGALALPCDLAKPEQVERTVARARAACGRIDVLVNNAGASDGPADPLEEPLEAFARVVALNLGAAFQLSCRVASDMLERGAGSIVNIASIHGLVASAPNAQSGYAASKGGLLNLTRDLACHWARRGVRVNAIAPGYFETELTAGMLAGERGRAWVERNTPMARPGRPEELDGALLFLASDASSYVTGSTVVVDGGWTAR